MTLATLKREVVLIVGVVITIGAELVPVFQASHRPLDFVLGALPVLAALFSRNFVTPVSSPRAADGTRLVKVHKSA